LSCDSADHASHDHDAIGKRQRRHEADQRRLTKRRASREASGIPGRILSLIATPT